MIHICFEKDMDGEYQFGWQKKKNWDEKFNESDNLVKYFLVKRNEWWLKLSTLTKTVKKTFMAEL